MQRETRLRFPLHPPFLAICKCAQTAKPVDSHKNKKAAKGGLLLNQPLRPEEVKLLGGDEFCLRQRLCRLQAASSDHL